MKVPKEIREARKKQTAEVFTPPELCNEMLDKLPAEVWASVEKTFLDNSCGNGNFLVEIYKRKVDILHFDPVESLKSVYGVDLMADNVQECQHRLIELAIAYGIAENVARAIVGRNIVRHNALTYDYEFADPADKPKSAFLSSWGLRK
jgi:type I restriction-modification system DNA methylase subunit